CLCRQRFVSIPVKECFGKSRRVRIISFPGKWSDACKRVDRTERMRVPVDRIEPGDHRRLVRHGDIESLERLAQRRRNQSWILKGYKIVCTRIRQAERIELRSEIGR